MHERVTGVFPALVSPQSEDQRVAHDELASLAGALVEKGAAGVLVNGHTGSLLQLRGSERADSVRTVASALGSRGLIIAGVHAQSPHAFQRHAEGAAKAGATHILVFPPYAFARGVYDGTPHDARAYFETISADSPLPLIVMQLRAPTRLKMPAELLAQVASLDSVVAIKEEVDDGVHYEEDSIALRLAAPDVSILTATHRNMLGNLAVGADGCLAGMANFVRPIQQMLDASSRGDLTTLRGIGLRLHNLAAAIYAGPGFRSAPRLVYAAYKMGLISTPFVRSPMTPVTPEEREIVNSAIQTVEDLL